MFSAEVMLPELTGNKNEEQDTNTETHPKSR